MTTALRYKASSAGLGLVLLAAAACSSPAPAPSGGSGSQAPAGQTQQQPQQTRPAGGFTLVIGALEEPGSLSGHTTMPHHFPEHVPFTLIYDSLIQVQPDGSIGPRLATEWKMGSDGKEYTFTLTDKAKWPDGKPVTAADVKASWEAALDPKNAGSMEGLGAVDKVEAPDARTVKVTLKRVDPVFLPSGGSRLIMPKHIIEGKDLSKDEYNQKPVSGGPFLVTSWTKGAAITMEANPDYWRGKPAIDRIVFKHLPDPNVQITQLRSGEINYANIAPKDLPVVQGIPGIKVYDAPNHRYFDIAPNHERPYFKDAKVREALLTAMDRQGIVDKVLGGRGFVMHSNVSPHSWAFNPNLPKITYNKDRAKALLAEAGWTPGSDGILQKDGTKFSFSVLINSYDRVLEQGLVVIQQNLKDVGIDMKIERVDPGVFNARRARKEFDAVSRVWNPIYDPDQAGLLRTGNFYNYSNPEVDKLATDALASLDPAVRKPIYHKLQEVLAKDNPRLWLYSENAQHALTTRISGVVIHPANFFWNIHEWKVSN